LLLTCGVVAYSASAATEVELPDGRRVAPAAAFAGAVAALGTDGYEVMPAWALLIVAALVGALTVWLVRRKVRAAVVGIVGLSVAFGVMFALERVLLTLSVRPHVAVMVAASTASCAYFGCDLVGSWIDTTNDRREGRGLGLFVLAKTGIPLAVVFASTTGLVVLAIPRLSWLAFVILFIPVLVVRQEFQRFRMTRRTYEQTVRSLAGLAEGAGYVPQGHSKRVADLCVLIATDLGVQADQVRELELVALLHDVGSVSLPDPSDVRKVSAADIAKKSGRLLEETEHLASYADLVSSAAGMHDDLPLEARILRVANLYDESRGSKFDRICAVRANAPPGDDRVIRALGRIVAERP
jgi:hypothetical protein